jgi:glycosyltransferase involved in cell wall biosynthesis
MRNIFINGLNAKAGGGKSILTNFLSLLSKSDTEDRYWVLVPDAAAYKSYRSDCLSILELPKLCRGSLLFPLVNRWILPQIVQKKACQLVFNLSDVPMPTLTTQIFLFDWPYAVFPESPAWQMMDFKSWLVRKAKLYYFKKYLRYVDLMIAQTPVIKTRLERLYSLKGVEVVPNAVSLDNFKGESTRDFQLGEGLKLLYLAYYYPHKNIEIFLPLAEAIRAQNLKIRIVTTIAPEQHPKAKEFLQQVEQRGLNDIIHNVGTVAMKDVPSLYAQTDGLLMPTLLESFSGTYVEAMFHGKAIYTSDLDFAKAVCGDAAYYFDPYNYQDILEKILESQRDQEGKQLKIEAGKRMLHTWSTWEQAFQSYLQLFDKASKCVK